MFAVEGECLVEIMEEPTREGGLIVLIAWFIGSHVSLALQKQGDGLVGVDNFNDYYKVSLKSTR
jgi:UDP-glucuronate 4-epimerase